MQEVTRELLYGERALFNSNDLHITECVFDNGESPLKESTGIELDECLFRWKYPLWYCNNIKVQRCTWFDMVAYQCCVYPCPGDSLVLLKR